MSSEQSLLLDFTSPCGKYLLTFDDDGKVAYAYLKKKRPRKSIVGDVWIYNRCPTPKRPEWESVENIPFANCRPYIGTGGRMTLDVESDDVAVDWEYESDLPIAYIYVFEQLYAAVGVGDKPGYSRFANKDGPLAKVMEFEE